MLKIWGRVNSINVQKVLWCCGELELRYDRLDAGMQFGVNNTPEYKAKNPNALVPTIEDDGLVLWESQAIVRYLARKHGLGSLCPSDPQACADADRWMDWNATTVWLNLRPVFWNLVRTPPEKRDMVQIQKDADAEAVQWRIVDAELAARGFIEGDQFTIADIALGAYARRWLGVEGVTKPVLPNLERWFAQFAERPGFVQFIAPSMT